MTKLHEWMNSPANGRIERWIKTPPNAPLGLLLITVLVIITLLACNDSCRGEKYEAKFSRGQFVQSVLTHQIGQVVKVFRFKTRATYDVRLPVVTERTNIHLVDPDGNIEVRGYALVYFDEFELRAVQGEIDHGD